MHSQRHQTPTTLKKYNINAPRYTSYPTALEFKTFSLPETVRAYAQIQHKDTSLYVHIPFCHSLCYYCGCNKIVTPHQHKAEKYLDYLSKEIHLLHESARGVPMTSLHLGGGSPSFLSLTQHQRLMHMLTDAFTLVPSAEKSIEIDPRRVDKPYIDGLAALGYTRLSMGVQDINAKVQTAINRVQDTTHIHQLVVAARAAGFISVNLDLIYGLPHQHVESFTDTLQAVVGMRPDRISLFSYAHLPERFAAQRRIKEEWLPDAQMKSALMSLAQTFLKTHGYVMIGMDHFALPQDTLAHAKSEKRLFRNFQGYTTNDETQLMGLGVSAISHLSHAFTQNHKELSLYYAALDAQHLPTDKGCWISADDHIRGFVISQLMCNMRVNFADISVRFAIDAKAYFADELVQLTLLVADGLVELTDTAIIVPSHARQWVRVVCSYFDAYLSRQTHYRGYSRVI